ncbi:MAG: carbon starvation CstA family protein, partial [Bradymonadaceae bacterium]
SAEAWQSNYASWEKVGALGAKVSVFINGAASFLEPLGVPTELGASFISVVVVSYALTSLDSATRLLRYNIEEIGETLDIEAFGNRYLSGALAAVAIGFFAFYEIDGKPAGLVLWQLFGTTNQLMAGLALLVVTLYLLMRDKQWYLTGIPMAAMLVTTLIAMAKNAWGFYLDGNYLLLAVGSLLFILGLWLVIEATIAIWKFKESGKTLESIYIDVDE